MIDKYNNIKELMSVFEMPKESILEMYSPYFYTYFKGYFSKPDKLIRKLNEMKIFLSRTNSQNAVLVDLGCGFGLECIMLSLITDNLKIIGIDHNEEKIRLARKLADQSKIQNVDFILQSGESLPQEMKADTVLSRNVLSHVNDITTFFDSIIVILKPNGILYIIDDRNALSLPTVWKTKRFQHKAENGKTEVDRLRKDDPKKNYFETRKEIISKNFKLMNDKKNNKYARMTAGLYGDQIISFIESAEKGQKVNIPKFKYINPITGESCERLYNPFYIKRVLKGKGLQVVIDKPFFGFPKRHKSLKKTIASLIENFHPISLFISPCYHIKAQKI